VKPRRVRFTDTARQHVDREHSWWLQNRDHRDVFVTDLEAAIQVVAVLPGAGTPYVQGGVTGLRRIYLRRLDCHIYYTFDDHEVLVRAVWGARRERGPAPL
jgi:plasmid stabilization system protein ParE